MLARDSDGPSEVVGGPAPRFSRPVGDRGGGGDGKDGRRAGRSGGSLRSRDALRARLVPGVLGVPAACQGMQAEYPAPVPGDSMPRRPCKKRLRGADSRSARRSPAATGAQHSAQRLTPATAAAAMRVLITMFSSLSSYVQIAASSVRRARRARGVHVREKSRSTQEKGHRRAADASVMALSSLRQRRAVWLLTAASGSPRGRRRSARRRRGSSGMMAKIAHASFAPLPISPAAQQVDPDEGNDRRSGAGSKSGARLSSSLLSSYPVGRED